MLHQLILCHDKASIDDGEKVYDLGWFEFDQLPTVCQELTSICAKLKIAETKSATNLFMAWAHSDYHAYLLPEDRSQPVWEFTGDGPMPLDEDDDPRVPQ